MKTYKLSPRTGNETIAELMRREKIDIDFPCGGNHTCGKCKVSVFGCLSEISPSEAKFLSQEEINSGIRLACFAKAYGEVTIQIKDDGECKIASDGTGALDSSAPMMQKNCLGAAIDIGTTTVVCKLYNGCGEELGAKGELNAQKSYGADVISRINYGIHNGNEALHNAITEQIERMLDSLAAEASAEREKITHAVVTGNTTMLHFFAGLDPRGIGFAPFVAKSLFGNEYHDIPKNVTVYIPPCISAYVGADLVCCVLASDMCSKDEMSLIVDIGTNGEMALTDGGKIICCSTAAGPAFEGAGISHGMVAAAGAISHVFFDAEKEDLNCEIIGNGSAAGICGSGVLDAMAVLSEQKIIMRSGRLTSDAESPLADLLDEDETKFTFPGTCVSVTQEDVRQVQLAKGAIKAGALTLLEYCGCSAEELAVLYLCGGFGSFLTPSSAETVGLIPDGTSEKTVVMGNGAVTGAAMLLLDKTNIDKISGIVASSRYVELSGNDIFMEHYIDSMAFSGEEEE